MILSYRSVMRPYRFAWAVAALTLASMPARAAIVDFEEPDVALGTVYGVNAMPPNNVGDIVLVQDGIVMSVDVFIGGPPQKISQLFHEGTVGGSIFDTFPELFESTPLQLNNLSAVFNFENAEGFETTPVTTVTVDFQQFDGTVNVNVNDQMLFFVLYSFNDLPVSVAPGIDVTVGADVLTFSSTDGITEIDSLLIGGQELTIDNVTAIPEPSVLVLIGIGAGTCMIRRWKARIAN